MYQAVAFDEAAKERIAEAEKLEKRLRLEAFLDIETDIGLMKLRPMTIRDAVQLEYAENQLICGGIPDETDFQHFCMLLKSHSEKRSYRKIARLVKRNLLNEAFLAAIFNYIDYTFLDAPMGKKGGQSTNVWACTATHYLAHAYGWTSDQILDMPIARLLQYVQCVQQMQLGKKYVPANRISANAKAKELNRALGNG